MRIDTLRPAILKSLSISLVMSFACAGAVAPASDLRADVLDSRLVAAAPGEAWAEEALSLVDLDIRATGQGSVVLPDATECAAHCTWAALAPATVELLATPAPGGVHVGWSGACHGQSSRCVVALGAAATTTAIFAARP